MKVMCIDNTAPCHPDCIGYFMPIEGGIYTVNGGFESNGEYFYQLLEDSAGNGWNSIYFIPLSDIDEKQIHHEKKTIRQSINHIVKN